MIWRFYQLLLLGSMLVLGACQQDVREEPFLRLSEQTAESLRLSSEATEQYVTVETNQGSWQAVCHADWLSVSQPKSSTLALSVQRNDGTEARTAEVVILAGGLSRKVRIVQAGQSPSLVVDQQEYHFGQWAEEFDIAVNTSTNDWQVVSSADWLQVEAQPHLSRMVVRVEANSTYDARQGTLTLTYAGGTAPVEVHVYQAAQMSYYFPFCEWGKNFETFGKSELARRSLLVDSPAEAQQVSAAKPFYIFETGSKLFPFVKYEMLNIPTRSFLFRIIMLAANDGVVRSDEFASFVQQAGYVQATRYTTSDGYRELYINSTAGIRLQVTVKGTSAELCFTPVIAQPQAYPTLSSLYLGNTDFGTANKAAVRQSEESNGSEYSSYWTSTYVQRTKSNVVVYLGREPYYMHSYIFTSKHILRQSSHFTDDLHLGMYKYANLYYLTREFEELLAREGFRLLDVNTLDNSYIYVNTDRSLGLWIYNASWNDEPVLAYNVLPI